MSENNDTERLDEFLRLLRESSDGTTIEVFTKGGCYKLHEMVKLFFPEAEAWYDGENGHVYTFIFGGLYDIFGRHEPRNDVIPIKGNYTDSWLREAEKWRY